MTEIKAGIWEHYKGGLYLVLGIAAHSETDEQMVVYVSLSKRPGPRLRVRPLRMWEDTVLTEDGERQRYIYKGLET